MLQIFSFFFSFFLFFLLTRIVYRNVAHVSKSKFFSSNHETQVGSSLEYQNIHRRYIYIYIYIFYVCFGIPKKTLPVSHDQMKRIYSLKHAQHFDTQFQSKEKKGKKRKKRKIFVTFTTVYKILELRNRSEGSLV